MFEAVSAMTRRHNYFRLNWVALVAFIGTLSVASGASASTTSGSLDTGVAGCCRSGGSHCCCKATAPASSRAMAERSFPLAMKPARLATPARSCECRSSEQPAPGRTPEPRRSESHSDRDRGESVDVPTFVSLPASCVFPRLIIHADGLSHLPLYLRTARLLI
jgi:hypothetical protein